MLRRCEPAFLASAQPHVALASYPRSGSSLTRHGVTRRRMHRHPRVAIGGIGLNVQLYYY